MNKSEAGQLLTASDQLLRQAHSVGHSTVESKSGLDQYYNLIKASLNCLMTVLDRCQELDAESEARICYRTSQILLRETLSYDLASEYCLRGIQSCSRSETLAPIKARLELLNFQVQYRVDGSKDRKSSLAYMHALITNSQGSLHSLYVFAKYRYFGMTYSGPQRLMVLTELATACHDDLYLLVSVCKIEQLLTQCQPIETVKSAFIDLQYAAQELSVPIQFKAVLLLLDLLISVQEDDFNESKRKITVIDAFVRECAAQGNTWKEKFTITVEDIPLELSWLTFTEFSLLSYFYCGVSYLVKSWDGKHRSQKLFKHCHDLISYDTTAISVKDMEASKLRTTYFNLLMSVYESLSQFGDASYEPSDTLKSFVVDYDNGQFSSQELVVHHQLISPIIYIWALSHHKQCNFQLAKYYYLKLRKLNSPIENELSMSEFFTDAMLTKFLDGMDDTDGTRSQLYLISSFNLLSVTLNELHLVKSQGLKDSDPGYPDYMDKLSKYLKMKDLLIAEITPLTGNRQLMATVECLEYAAGERESLSECVAADDWIDQQVVAPLLSSVIYYIRGKCYRNDKTKPELANVNGRIVLFSKSYKESLKLHQRQNMMARLASGEIYKIMVSYRNYFDEAQLSKAKANMELE